VIVALHINFKKEEIKMKASFEDYSIITFDKQFVGAKRVRIDRMDISVMLTPHFGDIDPPHRNGSKNR
jgi:hypothetical protein